MINRIRRAIRARFRSFDRITASFTRATAQLRELQSDELDRADAHFDRADALQQVVYAEEEAGDQAIDRATRAGRTAAKIEALFE